MSNETPPHVRLMDLVMGNTPAQAVYAAASLGVADHLGDAPVSARKVAGQRATAHVRRRCPLLPRSGIGTGGAGDLIQNAASPIRNHRRGQFRQSFETG